MNPQKHTPGPWRTHDVQPEIWTRQVWTDESHGSVMIATTGGVDKEANARLIAAAPELLAALKALVEWAAFTGGWEAPCWDDARAAIKKAEGGPA